MGESNYYTLKSGGNEAGFENPLEMVKAWRSSPNARIFVAKWATVGEGESVLIGEPIDVTHLALHLIEDERERGQRRAR